MSLNSIFITTAIDYTNAAPHIGHAYEKILADVFARHFRDRGRDVFFLTGVDQHGQKVQQAAAKESVSPGEFASRVTSGFIALWNRLGISYDAWAQTTDGKHTAVVKAVLADLYARGQIYKAAHRGFYSVRQEQFLTDKDMGPDGTFAPEWGEVIELEEENWYFKLSDYREWLTEFVSKHPEFVFPEYRQRELANALDKMVGDLCISRPKSRLSWGIELPFDRDFVTYVWFDALINYISFAGYLSASPDESRAFENRWSRVLHVIGKDILVPAHGVYWPVMLKALGFDDAAMPALLVHGYINLSGAKVSKSLGNVIDPVAICDTFGVDALRYYLMRDCACGQDMEFNQDRLISRYNVDLANGLGNLLNRTSNMTHRYRGGSLNLPGEVPESASRVLDACDDARVAVCAAFDAFQPNDALEKIMELVSLANGFAESEAPWKLAKSPDDEARLDAVLATMAQVVWTAASLLTPFVPAKAAEILEQLRLPAIRLDAPVPRIAAGHLIAKPVPVFPRIEAVAA